MTLPPYQETAVDVYKDRARQDDQKLPCGASSRTRQMAVQQPIELATR